MSESITHDTAAALAKAQGVPITPGAAADTAKFAALVLGNSAKAFASLAFETEPSGYTAAMRTHAP